MITTAIGALSDRLLLERFAHRGDDPAFDALVRRHGRLVMGVCRRILRQEQDAEDAFQATFLTLARRAGRLAVGDSLAGWLYRVAYHTALKAKAGAERRRRREEQTQPRTAADPLADLSAREFVSIFDEEMHKLAAAEREPLVLCYLEGRTRDEAARLLGVSTSTLKRRLEAAKEALRGRLARRGATLSAGLAAALASSAEAGMSLRTATVAAARRLADGAALDEVVSVGTAELMRGPSRVGTIFHGVLAAVVLLAALVGFLGKAPAVAEDPAPAAAAPQPEKRHTVSGRVLDDDRSPVAGARVAVVAERKTPYRGGELSSEKAFVLGTTTADADGRFRLDVPRTSTLAYRAVWLVARGQRHGLGWVDLNPDAENPTSDLFLTRALTVRGRLLDIQGQPAVGVRVRLVSVGVRAPGEFKGVAYEGPKEALALWPAPATTDADGRFTVPGVGSGIARLRIEDDRFATAYYHVDLSPKAGPHEVNQTLAPANPVEGVVLRGDTGKPLGGARLTVYASDNEVGSFFGVDGVADAAGRFRINPSAGKIFEVTAYAPPGEPYLTFQHSFKWPKAAVSHRVELTLPRGVPVRGKVTEAGGAPVAEASILYVPRVSARLKGVVTGWANAAVSGPDGSFALTVPPGVGHLLVHGGERFILSEMDARALDLGKSGGLRHYAHAFVPLDLKTDDRPEPTVTLTRGATVRCRIVDPQGKPVAEALVLSRLQVTALSPTWRGFPAVARDGRYELHGLDPKKSCPVLFLDPKSRQGATVEVSGSHKGDLVVRLEPCGQATTRLVDGKGKPLAKQRLWLEVVVTPGVSEYDLAAQERGEQAADAAAVANVDRHNHWEGPLSDADGRITFPALVPGATYRIVEVGDRKNLIKAEFRAESGKTTPLADVVRRERDGE